MQFLSHLLINQQQWDECIESSQQNLIYGKWFYLTNMCATWSALIGDDYKWVFPVIHKTKWGISYLYQPPFTQQLGIFAKPGVQPPKEEIITWLQKHYKFWEVSWNADAAALSSSSFIATEATNFTLDLSLRYDSLKAGYTNDLRKNLKRSTHQTLQYKPAEDFDTCIELYRRHYSQRMPHVKSEDYNNFKNLCGFAQKHGMLVCRAAVNPSGHILATALLLLDGNRLYNIMNTTTAEGKQMSANHFLLDCIVKEFSSGNLVLDFEGSDIPGVKQFYENFGATNQPYYNVRYNRLPWWVKFFKK